MLYSRMGMGTPQDLSNQHTGQHDVVNVLSPASDFFKGILPWQNFPDHGKSVVIVKSVFHS
jgi:hypothetical protein